MEQSLDIVRKQFEKDKFAKSLGIVLDELTFDMIRMHMQLRDDMFNWFDRPHGGVIYTLADAAFSVLANSNNNLAVALDCSITYHASPDLGALLTVEGEILSSTRRTAAYLFKIYMEKEKTRQLVATMKSVSYRTGKTIDPHHVYV
ncbi:MAG: hotdog fold thioesterase [Desulfobacterales bacterium]